MSSEVKEYTKPLPPVTKLNAPFWEGTKRGELRLQNCTECGHWWFPPSTHCPNCLSRKYEWKAVSGRGKVWSWIVMHQRYFREFEADLPYNIALIELEEGPRMMSRIAGIANNEIVCDMPVKVAFEEANDQQSVPYFVPA